MKFTDAEILAAIDSEEQLANNGADTLAAEREKALDRFKGAPTGDEQPGRSSVVDMSVPDTILWIMPSLMRIFMGGDEIGRFEARGPEDEKAAEQETKVCNWMLENYSDVYTQVYATCQDVLLLKSGYMVAQWRTESVVMTETYQGLAPEEAAMIAQDKEVEIVEQRNYTGPLGEPLYDCKVARKQPREYVAVESVPPDEMLISRRHRWTSLADCDFTQWRHPTTIGELRAQGFEVEDEEPADDIDLSGEGAARDRFGISPMLEDETADPTRRRVVLKTTYIHMDLRGKGQQQLWCIHHLSGGSRPLRVEEADFNPFAAFAAILYSHNHVGLSVYDLVNDVAIIKQTLKRQLLDNVYVNNHGESVLDADRCEVDDWLISRPGGIKRVHGPIGDAYAPVMRNDMTAGILTAIEFIDGEKEARTGVTKYSSGLDANSLNKTATGVQQITAAANQRIELIARTLATGFRDLFLIIHALICKHSTKPLQVKLDNEWVTIDPRSWAKRTDFTLSVGLGTGTPEQQIQKLMMMVPVFERGHALGLVGPDEVYEFGREMLKAAGWKNTRKFWKPPQKDPQTGQSISPPPPPPEAVLVEQERQKGAQMLAQVKAQTDGAMKQMDAMVKQKELELQAMLKKMEQEGALALQQSNDMRQSALDQQKTNLEMQTHAAEQETKIQIANIGAASASEVARINHGLDDGTAMLLQQAHAAGYAPVLEQLAKVTEMLSQEKEVVRGPDGKVSGVRPKQMQAPPTVQ